MRSNGDRPRVAGVVLAAGLSTRMGRNKLFLELSGESLVRRSAKAALASGLDPVIVVIGHEAERVVAATADLRCATVLNPGYARGINSSISAGVLAVPESADAAVVALADMPFVSAEMIATLVQRYEESRAPLVVSMYGDVTAPPMLYDRALFPELTGRAGAPAAHRGHVPYDQATHGEGCGKRVLKHHRADAVFVAWPPALVTDLDIPEEYERVRALIEGGRSCDAR